MITMSGEDLDGVEVSVEAASHETYKGRLSYGNRFAGGAELLDLLVELLEVGRETELAQRGGAATRIGRGDGACGHAAVELAHEVERRCQRGRSTHVAN